MSDAPEDVVTYAAHGAIVRLTIDRPERRNALTPGVIVGLAAGIARAQEDRDARVLVLTGAGDRAFCAGADLERIASAADALPLSTQPAATYADVLRALSGCTLPTVARINGHCMAGGMGLLAACDLAVASDAARFGLPEVKVGLFAMQVLSVIRALVGTRVLYEMTLTGEPLDAREALAAGLLNYVVPAEELDTKVRWLSDRLIATSPAAQRRGKAAMRAIEGRTAIEALPFLADELTALLETDDAREGARAFVERRPPIWTGR